MIFTEKLNMLMRRAGLTRGSLSKAVGIPYTTIMGFYNNGYENMRLSNLIKLADFFDVPIEYLCDDSQDLPGSGEDDLQRRISTLSFSARTMVSNLVDELLCYEKSYIAPEEDDEEPNIEYIREYVTPAAAGYASPAEGEDYILIPKNADVPDKADFAVRISGDSMEPYIADGSRVYAQRTNELTPGDVGIFFVDGDMKCKQYCEDSFGNIYLFSLNRARSDADVIVWASSGSTVFCFGKVLLPSRPALPKL